MRAQKGSRAHFRRDTWERFLDHFAQPARRDEHCDAALWTVKDETRYEVVDSKGRLRVEQGERVLARSEKPPTCIEMPEVRRLLDGDASIPAGRVRRQSALVIADHAAAEEL